LDVAFPAANVIVALAKRPAATMTTRRGIAAAARALTACSSVPGLTMQTL
jgi:hypothetical protein